MPTLPRPRPFSSTDTTAKKHHPPPSPVSSTANATSATNVARGWMGIPFLGGGGQSRWSWNEGLYSATTSSNNSSEKANSESIAENVVVKR
jgi:hypothetical protein